MTHEHITTVDALIAIHEQRNSAYVQTRDKVNSIADSDKNLRARHIDYLLSHYVLPRLEHIKAELTQHGYASNIKVTRTMLENADPTNGQLSEIITQLELSFSPLPLADNLPPPATDDYRILFFARPQSVFISSRYITPIATSGVQSIYFADDNGYGYLSSVYGQQQGQVSAQPQLPGFTGDAAAAVGTGVEHNAQAEYCHHCPIPPCHWPPHLPPHQGAQGEIDAILADFIGLTLLIERAQLTA